MWAPAPSHLYLGRPAALPASSVPSPSLSQVFLARTWDHVTPPFKLQGLQLDQLLGQAPLNFRPHFLCSCSLQTQAHAVHTSVFRLFPLPETSLPTSDFLLFQNSPGSVSRKLSFEEYFHSILPDRSHCSYIIAKVAINVSAFPQNCTFFEGRDTVSCLLFPEGSRASQTPIRRNTP